LNSRFVTAALTPSPEYLTRFGGLARLYSAAGLERLRVAHVGIVGVGGVGSWAVEALARSGVGRLTLVDLDEVCVSNVNRQLPALDGHIGRPKVEVLAERVRAINPEIAIEPLPHFFTASTADRLLAPRYDAVVDAIDDVANKCLLIARCRELGTPLVTCGGAGGRRDPTRVRTADLANATHDRLLGEVRRRLRREFGFPPDGLPFGVACVYSSEPPVYPQPDGSVCATRPPEQTGADLRLNCDAGFGTATFVTGAFGFAAAAWVVGRIAGAKTAD
jgi:tRNA A37 threonylcarbamoyladenosine dehydratase